LRTDLFAPLELFLFGNLELAAGIADEKECSQDVLWIPSELVSLLFSLLVPFVWTPFLLFGVPNIVAFLADPPFKSPLLVGLNKGALKIISANVLPKISLLVPMVLLLTLITTVAALIADLCFLMMEVEMVGDLETLNGEVAVKMPFEIVSPTECRISLCATVLDLSLILPLVATTADLQLLIPLLLNALKYPIVENTMILDTMTKPTASKLADLPMVSLGPEEIVPLIW